MLLRQLACHHSIISLSKFKSCQFESFHSRTMCSAFLVSIAISVFVASHDVLASANRALAPHESSSNKLSTDSPSLSLSLSRSDSVRVTANDVAVPTQPSDAADNDVYTGQSNIATSPETMTVSPISRKLDVWGGKSFQSTMLAERLRSTDEFRCGQIHPDEHPVRIPLSLLFNAMIFTFFF